LQQVRGIPCATRGTGIRQAGYPLDPTPPKGDDMRGLLLWLVGIPIPVIILLYLFHVI